MVSLTRLNGKAIVINALLIETIEETPDTVISLTTGKKIMVLESAETVIGLIQAYMQKIGTIHTTIQSMNTEGS
ncbi:flagellar FlbD family protein [Paenibacillus larvae]|uniref:Flagellar-like protein n=4 Tax=Paenibacillus larvae TaxID=1464 RepID=V9WA04_9BACL|nr:flagellar FlbD family protein [Paenibacillus larvae]AHD05952.1 flagellar-like protein [Paenibacillus larvae subsp. larvae DSM 25430]AQR76605.1 flagellar protein D [Paenibacillus larvae subsp. larvae]AQT83640.1 flagellar protein D [Paenibacillus larvae subsp. pulvifaciens]AQZ48777.1 flagellar protein D [Paenibacillus larvae subsp. pulvifaciens]ARF69922.1 flagellar protein D [Paenibacillus larvae subsp. pulvifaciens]